MKYFINRFLVALMILLLSTVIHANIEDCPDLYKVTATQLNVRDQPSTSGRVIGTLRKNEQVCISEEYGNWGKENNGWVSMKHLIPIPGVPSINQHGMIKISSAQNIQKSADTSIPTKSNMDGEIATSVFVLIIAIYIIMLMIGMAGKVVVYYDEADLVISLLPWLVLFVTVVIAGIYQPTEQDLDPERMLQIQKFVWYSGGLLSAGFAIWAIQLSIKYNRSIPIGFIFGVFKLLSGLIGVLVLISQVFTMKDEKTKRKDFWFAILVFGAFWWLGKKLINGKKVYREKGWNLEK